MPQVELAADPALELILLHNLLLYPGGHLYQLGQRPFRHRALIGVGRILDYEGLEQLCRSGNHLRIRQGFKRLRTDEGGFRLAYYTDHILERVQVDSVLSTDGRIDLGEQGSGDETELYAPFIDGCSKSRDVRSYTAAYSQEEGFPVRTLFHQPAADFSHGSDRLVLLRGFNSINTFSQGSYLFGNPGDIPVADYEQTGELRNVASDLRQRAVDYVYLRFQTFGC